MLHIVSRTARKNPAVVYVLPMEKATDFIRQRIAGLRNALEVGKALKRSCVGSGVIKVPFDADDFMNGTLRYISSQCACRVVMITGEGDLLAIDQRQFTMTVDNLWDGLPHIDNLLSLHEELLETESRELADELQEADDALADARTDYEEVFAKMFSPIAPGELHKLEGEWALCYFAQVCKVGDVLLRRKQLYIRNI